VLLDSVFELVKELVLVLQCNGHLNCKQPSDRAYL